MKKVLFISFDVPYDGVPHAGGKTHNYYLKKVAGDEEFEVYLMSFCVPDDLLKFDCPKYAINFKLFCIEPDRKYKLKRGLFNISSRYNPWDRCAGTMPGYYKWRIMRGFFEMKEDGYVPDIIVLEWTPIVLVVGMVKKFFPNAKIIASEHDVTFLGFMRKYKYEKNPYKKWLAKVRYNTMHDEELKAIRKCDYVFPHNRKDANILLKNGIEKSKIHPIVPYYTNFSDVKWNGNSRNVVFFGAMGRPENHLSAIWFIEKVMPLLEGTGIVFQIIGGGPSEKLKSMESENVRVMGYVEDVAPYFSDALCMVCPLVLGAGIKVKVLEGMSSGMPVLTNDIGIEGICAQDGKDYIHCEAPEEYAESIRTLIGKHELAYQISRNARKLIQNQFDMEKSALGYIDILKSL